MKFCSNCGHPVEKGIPPGDDRLRHLCGACGMIHYRNPKMVVGCIPVYNGRILLCRRAIEPRHGKWTLPAGYLENGESMAQGAAREAMEEAGVSVIELEPFGLYNLTFVDQVYMIFRARMQDERFAPGTESLDVKLFDVAAIPWEELAFTVVYQALVRYVRNLRQGRFPFLIEDIEAKRFNTTDGFPVFVVPDFSVSA